MENKIHFVGNNKPSSLKTKFYIHKYIKSLPKNNKVYYGFRENSLGQYFLIHGNNKELIATTFISVKDDLFVPEDIAEAQISINSKELNIDYIEVYEDYRNQGIGGGIIDFLKNVAITNKVELITLERVQTFVSGDKRIVFNGNLNEINNMLNKNNAIDVNKVFYEKHGFKDDKKRKSISDFHVPMVSEVNNNVCPKIKNFPKEFFVKSVKVLPQKNFHTKKLYKFKKTNSLNIFSK